MVRLRQRRPDRLTGTVQQHPFPAGPDLDVDSAPYGQPFQKRRETEEQGRLLIGAEVAAAQLREVTGSTVDALTCTVDGQSSRGL